MTRSSRIAAALLLIGHAAAGWGYSWNKDMVDQPSAKPQESEAPADPGGTPVTGGETMPAPTTERGMFDAKDAAVSVPNPVPATPESIARGRSFYITNCLVCHGEDGRGDGPVGKKFTDPSPVDLNDDYTQDQADGQLFFTLTRGRVAMPFYRDALNPEERWDVINYVKTEFGEK
jgi:mono/diheme cytochrome c family protein